MNRDPCIQIQSGSISATLIEITCIFPHIRNDDVEPFSPWPVSSFCRMVGMRGRLWLAGLFSRSCFSQTTRTTPTSRPSTSTSRRWLSCKSMPIFTSGLGCWDANPIPSIPTWDYYVTELSYCFTADISNSLPHDTVHLYLLLHTTVQYGKTHDVLTHIKTL